MNKRFIMTVSALFTALSLSGPALADERSKWGARADGYGKQLVHHRHYDYGGHHYRGGKRHYRQHRRHVRDHRRHDYRGHHRGYVKHYRGHRYSRFPNRYYREHRRYGPRYGSSIGLWLDGVGLRYSERAYCD